MKKIVVASNNVGKIKEIKSILNNYEILSLNDINVKVDVEENQNTFEGNALKKAKEIYDVVKMPVLSDDSGLCIHSLDGFPGVLSHRFLGENKTDDERNLALIDKVNGKSDRSASFITVIAYYDGKHEIIKKGEINGVISSCIKGENGFAYDRILKLSSGKTVAELTSEEKNNISARKKALIKINESINNL